MKKTDCTTLRQPMIAGESLRSPRADLTCRDTWPMFRAVLVRSLWVFLCGASLAAAQDPPPLEAPASEPVTPKASVPSSPPSVSRAPAAATGPTPTPNGPMLVIPGVTVPSSRLAPANRTLVPRSSQPLSSSPPAQGIAPSAVTGAGKPGTSPARSPGADLVRAAEPAALAPIPLNLEPLEDESASSTERSNPTSSHETPRRSPKPDPAQEPTKDRVPATTRPAPWRLPGLLGRAMGQPPAPGSAAGATRSADGATRAKTKSEPETDAVVKRRIEQQIRTTFGDKLQSVQVRVNGRNVLIVARPTRFWQKRGLQRVLESLPGLTGYRARIDLGN